MNHFKTIVYCFFFIIICQVSFAQGTNLKKGDKFINSPDNGYARDPWVLKSELKDSYSTFMAEYIPNPSQKGHQNYRRLYVKDFITDRDPMVLGCILLDKLMNKFQIKGIALDIFFLDNIDSAGTNYELKKKQQRTNSCFQARKIPSVNLNFFFYSENAEKENKTILNKRETLSSSNPSYEVLLKTKPEDEIAKRIINYVLIDEHGTVISTSESEGDDKWLRSGVNKKILKGRLLSRTLIKNNSKVTQEKLTPLANAEVTLKSGDNKTIMGVSKTDNMGDFRIETKVGPNDYNMVVTTEDTEVEEILLLSRNGEEISSVKKTVKGFNYRLIPADVVRLSEMPEEDISSSFDSFKSSGKKEITITEKILYASGQYQIDPKSLPTLDKVVQILKANPTTQLDVISHTDSNGDDNSNLALSEKRATSVVNYLVLKGIAKTRLNPIGKGETKIRNRCGNGVECSDKEHEFNRRTEFYFVKK